jgi:hypothetical protein
MAITVSKVEVWSAMISDQAGALDQILRTLAQAGDNLECVVGRRQPDQPGRGHVYMTPIKGKKAQTVARAAGLQPAQNIANLRIESPNKAGTGHKIMSAIAQAGINVRGISMIGSGNKSIAYIGFDSAADADRASAAIKALNKKAKR